MMVLYAQMMWRQLSVPKFTDREAVEVLMKFVPLVRKLMLPFSG